jgi:hypothetical protein
MRAVFDYEINNVPGSSRDFSDMPISNNLGEAIWPQKACWRLIHQGGNLAERIPINPTNGLPQYSPKRIRAREGKPVYPGIIKRIGAIHPVAENKTDDRR